MSSGIKGVLILSTAESKSRWKGLFSQVRIPKIIFITPFKRDIRGEYCQSDYRPVLISDNTLLLLYCRGLLFNTALSILAGVDLAIGLACIVNPKYLCSIILVEIINEY